MCANSEGSGKTVRMRRLAWAFAGRLYDKYHNLMSWLSLQMIVCMLNKTNIVSVSIHNFEKNTIFWNIYLKITALNK